MRSHTLLIVAALVLGARAASIPAPSAPPALQQKLAEAVEQALQEAKPQDNVHSEQELIEQVNEVKDIDNSLRKVPHVVDAIPVKIVTEVVQPSVKNTEDETKPALDDVELDSEPEIKRVKVDLSNTGEPQRQEHDSQSPEQQNAEQQTVANIKQTITDSQNVFNQGLQGVATDLHTWFTDNEQLASIQQSIQNLQVNFQTQLSKLNSTIQSFWKPEESAESAASSPTQTDTTSGTSTDSKGLLENVEKGLEVIENNFEYGVKSMVNGVQVLAAVKAENASSSNNPLQGLSQYFETFQNNIAQSLSNVQMSIQNFINQNQQNINNSNTTTGPTTGIFSNIGQSFQNIVNLNGQPTPAAGSVSDESAEGTTAKPTIWQGIQHSIQNIWNRPGQSSTQNQQSQTNQNAVGNGPIAQAIQNIPLYQGVVNLIQGPTPPTVCVDCEEPVGSNSVPAKPEEEKPQSDDQQKVKPETAPAPAPAPAPAVGPLAQIVQRNPIMQGLAGAVHKIQTSIVNPEKPREDDTKAGWYGGYGGHGHTPAQGNNINGDGVEGGKSEPLKEEAPVAAPETPAAPAAPADHPTLSEKVKECDKKKADSPVSDKTES